MMAVSSIFPVSAFPTPASCNLLCSLGPEDDCICDDTELIEDTGFDDSDYWTIVDNSSPLAEIDQGLGHWSFSSSSRGIYDEIIRPNVFTNGQTYTVQLDVYVGAIGGPHLGFRLYNGTQLVTEVSEQWPGSGPPSVIDVEFTADQDGDLRFTLYEISPSDTPTQHFIDNISVVSCI